MMLARLSRSGDLTAVRVPGAADEAVRDLVRAREDAVREQRNARHRLKALLLRNGIPYAGKSSWTAVHDTNFPRANTSTTQPIVRQMPIIVGTANTV